MKKFLLLIIILSGSMSLMAQKVIRLGPYEVVYSGTIIDTVLVRDPVDFYKLKKDTLIYTVKDTVIYTVKDTLFYTVRDTVILQKELLPKELPPKVLKPEVISPSTAKRILDAVEVNVSAGPAWIRNSRLDKEFFKPDIGFSMNLEALYKKRFASKFSFGAGLSFGMLKQGIALNTSVESIENLVDKDGDSYTGFFKYNDIEETTTLLTAGIPLTIGFDNISFNRVGFYGNITLKPSYVLSSKFDVAGSYTTTGYYTKWNIELHDVDQLGFYTDKAIDLQENVSKATASFNGKAAFGVTVPLSRHEDYDYNRNLLKIGVFFDYGKLLVKEGDINTTETNYYIGQNNLLTGSGISTIAVGIELGIIFGIK